MIRKIYIILLLIIFCQGLVAKDVNAKDWSELFEYSKYQNAKISPDGKYIAVALYSNGKVSLAFLDRKTLKVVGSAKFGGSNEVGDYRWVNNERVVIKMVKRHPWREKPDFYGELFAVNFDGSKGKLIYGYRAGEMKTGGRIKKKESIRGWGELINTLPDDEKHILISSTPMSDTGESIASVFKLNVYNGRIKRKLGRSPVPFASFLTDSTGALRVVSGTDKNNEKVLYIRKDGEWDKVAQGIVSSSVRPLSLSASGKHLFTIDDQNQDRDGIFKLNLEDYSYANVYTDKAVDITDVEMTTDGHLAYAIRVDEAYPAYLILSKKSQEAKIFKDLLKTFPYSEVNITSKTRDGNFYIVMVSSDIDPGKLYLFDKKLNQMKLLFKFKPKVKDSDFVQVEPIKFKASDGQEINGFFTAGKVNQKDKVAPVVVLVHGGPHGVRDYWGFSSRVQYLALNGYSVLQVNYRGSGGYGFNFQAAGYKAWGTTIQQDIFDAYQWLVKKNKAKDNNVCIMGGSFGGYSAIQSATLFPDVYKCAIANAGIYDLELMFDEGDIQSRLSGMAYLRNVLGTDETQLKNMSPVNYVEKLKVPLLLAHGKEDERAPFEHALRLRKALNKSGKTYEWFAIDAEGHGFYNPKNQKAYMKRVLEFLDKHLS